MTELFFVALICVIAMIFIFYLLIYWFRKKKQHKDFITVIISLIFIQFVTVLATYYTVADVIDYKYNRSVNETGKCYIEFVESKSSRFSEPEDFIQVTINNVRAEGKLEDFEHVQEGTFECEMKYTRTNQLLLDLVLK